MRFETDDYFVIGRSHVRQCMPCQDYASSRAEANFACAIVSDGCSTGNRTDIGARLTALAANKILNANFSPAIIDHHLMSLHEHLHISQVMLGLNIRDMLATCVIVAVKDDLIITKVLGDGVVAIKYTDGSLELNMVDWQNNTPFYPIYRVDMQQFFDAHKANEHPITKQVVIYNKDDEEVINSTTTYDIDNISNLIPTLSGIGKRVEYIGIFSDGVCQIDGLDWISVTKMLMKFPTTKGSFLKRRMTAMNNEFMKNGKGPIDDISGAVIHIIHEDE